MCVGNAQSKKPQPIRMIAIKVHAAIEIGISSRYPDRMRTLSTVGRSKRRRRVTPASAASPGRTRVAPGRRSISSKHVAVGHEHLVEEVLVVLGRDRQGQPGVGGTAIRSSAEVARVPALAADARLPEPVYQPGARPALQSVMTSGQRRSLAVTSANNVPTRPLPPVKPAQPTDMQSGRRATTEDRG
jgi:hypothetical protein